MVSRTPAVDNYTKPVVIEAGAGLGAALTIPLAELHTLVVGVAAILQ